MAIFSVFIFFSAMLVLQTARAPDKRLHEKERGGGGPEVEEVEEGEGEGKGVVRGACGWGRRKMFVNIGGQGFLYICRKKNKGTEGGRGGGGGRGPGQGHDRGGARVGGEMFVNISLYTPNCNNVVIEK